MRESKLNTFKVGDNVSYDYSSAWTGGKGLVTHVDPDTNIYMVQSIILPEGCASAYPNGDCSNWNGAYLKPFVEPESGAVDHPAHYGGDTTYEVIKVAEAWGLDKDAYLFNVVKYVARAGKKDAAKELEDLKKGLFYYQRRIKQLEEQSKV